MKKINIILSSLILLIGVVSCSEEPVPVKSTNSIAAETPEYKASEKVKSLPEIVAFTKEIAAKKGAPRSVAIKVSKQYASDTSGFYWVQVSEVVGQSNFVKYCFKVDVKTQVVSVTDVAALSDVSLAEWRKKGLKN